MGRQCLYDVLAKSWESDPGGIDGEIAIGRRREDEVFDLLGMEAQEGAESASRGVVGRRPIPGSAKSGLFSKSLRDSLVLGMLELATMLVSVVVGNKILHAPTGSSTTGETAHVRLRRSVWPKRRHRVDTLCSS